MGGSFKKGHISRQLKAMGLKRNRLTEDQVWLLIACGYSPENMMQPFRAGLPAAGAGLQHVQVEQAALSLPGQHVQGEQAALSLGLPGCCQGPTAFCSPFTKAPPECCQGQHSPLSPDCLFVKASLAMLTQLSNLHASCSMYLM